LENYGMLVGRYMVQGVDLWLNNPRRPLEASGTSGMKAAMNGGLNCSVLDGWWCEGYDPSHGWVLGPEAREHDPEGEDSSDAQDLYRVLEQEIVPCFYARDRSGLPVEWIQRMKRALGLLSPKFSTMRMVREYAESYYVPAVNGDSAAPR
jgi:starch phosphorylase